MHSQDLLVFRRLLDVKPDRMNLSQIEKDMGRTYP